MEKNLLSHSNALLIHKTLVLFYIKVFVTLVALAKWSNLSCVSDLGRSVWDLLTIYSVRE